MSTPPRFLAFSGSARRDSLNRKLLNALIEAMRDQGAEVTLIDLNDYAMPLYHGDLEDADGLPASTGRLVALIAQHPGLLIASPEYNSMMTPLLKNTIDWCTRAEENPFIGKVAAVVSASPGMQGGIRSLTIVRQLLTHLGAHVVPTQCILPHADKAFDPAGRLIATRTQESVRTLAGAALDILRKIQGAW